MFASILLDRLKNGGAENRLWPTQYGFRIKCGTADALFLARHAIEQAWGDTHGKAVLLALDWAKAFDSISPEALAKALLRYGVPETFEDMVPAIYTGRRS